MPDSDDVRTPLRRWQWRSCMQSVLDAILPGSCALCGTSGHQDNNRIRHCLCENCCEHYFKTVPMRCPVCARTTQDSAHAVPCGACLSDPPAFDATITVCDYAAPIDRLVQELKFHAQLALAPAFAQLLAGAVRQHGSPKADMITAVPLSAARLAERGFNQANEIAKPLAKSLGMQFVPGLCERIRETAAQAGLSWKERRANMRNCFMVSPGMAAIRNKHIMLVDDVMTTGQTLHALAACLKRYGATRVTNLVVAHTPLH